MHSTPVAIAAALFLFCLNPALAAYVQFRNCLDNLPDDVVSSSDLSLVAESLQAAVYQQQQDDNDDDVTRIALRLSGRFPSYEDCDSVQTIAGSQLQTISLKGGKINYDAAVANITCDRTQPQYYGHQGPLVRYELDFAIRPLQPVEAMELQVLLQGMDGKTFGCVEAPLAPKVNNSVANAARWIPICTLVAVIGAAVASLPMSTRAVRGHYDLTNIAECVSYIQFIFFSAALSLRYPGFLQPIASRSSWSTLMGAAGPASHDSPYYGLKDGIYETNGTMTGSNTYGLELMTQVPGAPVTIDTWKNVVAYAGLVFAFLIIVVETGRSLRPRTVHSGTYPVVLNIQKTIWISLRALLSYFLLPVVAWTTYQLDMADYLPGQHTASCAVVLVLLLVGCCWGASRSSPRRLGYLILEKSKHRQIAAVTTHSQDNLLSTALFALLFVRGAAIGGLQVVGLAQVLLLFFSEVMQLVLTMLVRPPRDWSSFFSTSILACLARAVVMVLCTFFLEGVAGFKMRCIIGYVVLALHGIVVVFLFLCPALYSLVWSAGHFYRFKSNGLYQDAPPTSPSPDRLQELQDLSLCLPQYPDITRTNPFPEDPIGISLPSSPSTDGSFTSDSSFSTESSGTLVVSPLAEAYFRRDWPSDEATSSGGSSDNSSSNNSSRGERDIESQSMDVAEALAWASAMRVAQVRTQGAVQVVDVGSRE